ncbi:helix-turn-helix domain-containing protein [Polaromonas glacialis]|uniref:helix-turn-helix domain-containing protein n=1 Tax=Polaromonas glacialis TaxID=866564 RepID=UPI00069111E2|nr:helix-turn-helix domain-containing protein [Polaromonas glacialis]
MSKDEAVLVSGIALNREAAGQPDTAGALLRTARQSQGLDIATLAALLKVPVHKLQALEQDQSALLADPVFARALAASMCRILKLDPAPVLQRLPAIAAFKVTSQNRGINTPFRVRSSSRNAVPFWSHISRPAVLVGLALLLGALVLMFLPSIQKEIARYRQAGQLETVPGQAVESASVTTTVITPTSPGNDVPGVSSTLVTPADVPAAATGPLATVSAGAEGAAGEPPMTISAKGASKIKVTDASGAVVLDRTLRAGESVSLSGVLPLAVVASRANVIQVQVRGQAFDLASVTKNNIARFEVK